MPPNNMPIQFHQTSHTAWAPLAALPCCFFVVFGLLVFVFWIWMLIDCLTSDFRAENDKIIWVLVLIFLNWIGALIYYFVGRPRKQPRQL